MLCLCPRVVISLSAKTSGACTGNSLTPWVLPTCSRSGWSPFWGLRMSWVCERAQTMALLLMLTLRHTCLLAVQQRHEGGYRSSPLMHRA